MKYYVLWGVFRDKLQKEQRCIHKFYSKVGYETRHDIIYYDTLPEIRKLTKLFKYNNQRLPVCTKIYNRI